MAKDKAPVEEKMALEAEVSVEVNAPLAQHVGVAVVAIACHACGLFQGLEHDLEEIKPCVGPDLEDNEHEAVACDRYDFHSVGKTEKRNGRVYLLNGRIIPKADDPDELEKQAAALVERAKAARAAKKG